MAIYIPHLERGGWATHIEIGGQPSLYPLSVDVTATKIIGLLDI